MTSPGLSCAATLPDRGFDATVEVDAGQSVALLGPNGAGKSTLLEIVAGLVRPATAQITLTGADDRILAALGGPGPTTWVPAYQRRVGLLAQDPGLFPHLSVLANIAFGPRSVGVSRRAARARALDWLERVQLGELAERRPGELSGGQAQRVALARAMAADPQVLLLDEPFAALDVEVAATLRTSLRELLADRTIVMATHDVLDAIVLADRIAVLDAGKVVESGPTAQVLRHPRSAFAASIAGFNLIAGTWDGQGLRSLDGQRIWGRTADVLQVGTAAVAVFRPAAVAVYPEPAVGSPRNQLPVVIEALEPVGAVVRVRAGGLIADVTPDSVTQLGIVPGARVHFVVKAAEVDIYPR